MLLANHVNIFYMGLCVSGVSHIKYTYIIGQEYSYAVLPNHASLSLEKLAAATVECTLNITTNLIR